MEESNTDECYKALEEAERGYLPPHPFQKEGKQTNKQVKYRAEQKGGPSTFLNRSHLLNFN